MADRNISLRARELRLLYPFRHMTGYGASYPKLCPGPLRRMKIPHSNTCTTELRFTNDVCSNSAHLGTCLLTPSLLHTAQIGLQPSRVRITHASHATHRALCILLCRSIGISGLALGHRVLLVGPLPLPRHARHLRQMATSEKGLR